MSKLTPNIDISLFKLDGFDTGPYRSSSEEDICLKQLQKEFNTFERIDYRNPRHKKELIEMFPKWLIENANTIDIELFQFMSRYDRKHNTFVAGIFNNSGDDLRFELISYKRRRVGKIKWMTRKGTHPNNMPFVRIYRDDTPIYVVEGHHDMLTAILLGLDFVMLPTAGFKDASIIKKALLDANVVFIVEDERAYNCMFGMALKIESIAKRITLVELSDEQKYDLSDFVMSKNSIEEVIYELKNK
jgi:hypothetical protein